MAATKRPSVGDMVRADMANRGALAPGASDNIPQEEGRKRSAAEADKKPMKPVSFLISEEDYEALKAVSSDLGLGIGSGIRFAIRDFLKRQGAK